MARRLTRNRRKAAIGGVAAGFADYFDVDPVLVRLGFVLALLLNGAGFLFYIICWVIMPTNEEENVSTQPDPVNPEAQPDPSTPGGRAAEEVRAAGERVVDGVRRSTRDPGRGNIIAGGILVAVGLMFLLDRFSWIFHWPHWLRFSNLWPLILVGVGISLLLRSKRNEAA